MIDDCDRQREPVTSLKRRKEAIGKKLDFPQDTLLTNLVLNAEEIFEPKRILNDQDWLKRKKEIDQTFESYK